MLTVIDLADFYQVEGLLAECRQKLEAFPATAGILPVLPAPQTGETVV